MTETVLGEKLCDLRVTPYQTSSQQKTEQSKLVPVIREANIVAKTRVEIPRGQPLTYRWEEHGFEIHIPAGAIPDDGVPVTMSIQASIGGNYQLPDDCVLVSGVYWLALHPSVEFVEKVTIGIQHCADADSALSFGTAKCSQKSLPYTFKPLPGGSFQPGIGTIQVSNVSEASQVGDFSEASQVSHFSEASQASHFSIFGWRTSEYYAIRTYYIPQETNIHVYVVHITVTPKMDRILMEVSDRYSQKWVEEGPYIPTVKFNDTQISVNIPQEGREKDGWKMLPLISTTMLKECVDGYRGGPLIPCFQICLKLTDLSVPQSLEQTVEFEGIQPPENYIVITRELEQQADDLGINRREPLILTSGLDLFRVFNELMPVCDKWKEIGLYLGLSPAQLNVIETSNTNFSGCTHLNEVLGLWLNKAYDTETLGEPSWRLLVRAVARPAGGNNPVLAEKIAKTAEKEF